MDSDSASSSLRLRPPLRLHCKAMDSDSASSSLRQRPPLRQHLRLRLCLPLRPPLRLHCKAMDSDSAHLLVRRYLYILVHRMACSSEMVHTNLWLYSFYSTQHDDRWYPRRPQN